MKEEKKEKPMSLFSEVQSEMMGSVIEGLLPKIQPFIKPAIEKFIEFLGENEKTILIRRMSNGNPTVFILDNTKGNYSLLNDAEKKTSSFAGSKEPSPIKDVYDITHFIEKLITGDLLKQIDK